MPILPGSIAIPMDRARRRSERTLEPHCEICNAECSDEDYCSGCGYYICWKCDKGKPSGKHELFDHKKMQSTIR